MHIMKKTSDNNGIPCGTLADQMAYFHQSKKLNNSLTLVLRILSISLKGSGLDPFLTAVSSPPKKSFLQPESQRILP